MIVANHFMKILFLTTCLLLILIAGSGQDLRDTAVENTFFWKITSPVLAQPSYLYGTMHKTCATDVWFSPLLLEILRSCKIFYNETLDIRILKDSAILIGKPKNGMQDFLGRNYFRSGRKILEKYYGAFTKEQLDNMGTTEFADRLIEACHECRVISYDDSLYNLGDHVPAGIGSGCAEGLTDGGPVAGFFCAGHGLVNHRIAVVHAA